MMYSELCANTFVHDNIKVINVKDLTQQCAQNIINRNVVFFRQFKARVECQKLINLVNNL